MHFTYNKKTFRENLNLAKIPFSYKEEKKCPDYNLHVSINLPSEVLEKTFRWRYE